MSDYLNILSQFVTGNPAVPASNSGAQEGSVSDEAAYRIAAAANNNTGTSITDPIQRDLLDLSGLELIQKYGREQGLAMLSQRAAGSTRFRNDRYAPGTGGLTDTASAVGLGLANSIGGLAALGSGLVNDDAGAWVSSKMGDFNDWARPKQSSVLNRRRDAYAVTRELSQADNQAKYENEKKTDGTLLAGLRRIGRDMIDGVSDTVDDGMILGDTVTEGVGSLLATGPVGKGIRSLGSATIKQMRAGGLLSRAGAVKAARVGEKLVIPAAIGAMEGGGAYQQTVQQVLGLSHDDLMTNSPDYQQLINDGWSPDDAKTEIATSSGLLAAGVQAPVGALTGTLVSKFEANPLRANTLLGRFSNIGKEGVEESIQSGSGQASSNVGISAFADQTQDLLAGVGDAAGVGGLAGMGSAGLVQVPGLAGDAVVGTGKAVVQGAKAAVQPLITRAQEAQAAREAESPVSATNLNTRAEEAVMAAPDVQAQVEEAVTTNNLTEDQTTVIRERVEALTKTIAFDPAELDNEQLSEPVKASLSQATNRFDALYRAAELARDVKVATQDRIDAALYITSALTRTGQQLVGDLIGALEPLPEDHPLIPQLRQYEDVLVSIQENPEIQQALKLAQQYATQIKENDLSDAAIATPKGQQAARGVVTMAESSPENVDPELAKLVLEHARQGRIRLTPQQTRTLSNSAAIVRIGNTYSTKAKELQLRPQDFVSKQIQNEDAGPDVVEKSAAAHAKGIMEAINAGKVADAAARLRDMMLFAEHMRNKVDALNDNLQNGTGSELNTSKYRALTAARKWVESPKGLWVNPKAAASVRLAQQINLDAQAVGEMANELARSMPELGIDPIELSSLDPVLDGPAADISKDFKTGKRTLVKAQPKAEAKPVTQPSPSPVQVKEPAKAEPKAQPEVKAESPATKTVEAKPEPTPEEVARPARQEEVPPPVEAPTRAEEKPVEVKTAEPEAAPEVASEPVADAQNQEVEDQGPKTLAEAYPELLDSKNSAVRNWFTQVYIKPKDTISRLFGSESPMAMMKTALLSSGSLSKLMGRDLNRVLTSDLVKAYGGLLGLGDQIAEAMRTNLATFLTEAVKKDEATTFGDLLVNGRDGSQVNEWFRGKALNIVEKTANGFAYNQELMEAAVLAGLQWLIVADSRTRSYDAEAAAKVLGIKESQVNQADLDWLNNGTWHVEAKRALGDLLVKYWGVVPDAKMPVSMIKGIAEGVAAEVLRGMVGAKLLVLENTKLHGKTYQRFSLGEAQNLEAIGEALKAFPNAIEQAALVEPEEVYYIGEPPAQVATNQLHGSPVELSEQQVEAVKQAQSTPYKVSRTMLAFVEMLGEEGVLVLFGKGNPNRQGLLKKYAESIVGYNRTLTSAYGHLMGLVAEMKNRAAATGEPVQNQSVFFRFGVTAVGRLQMLGRTNPQSSKLIREVLLPTQSTLDLSDRDGKDYQAFMLAIGQHLGVKVHKLSVAEAISKTEGLLSGQHAEVVEMLHKWQEGLTDKQTPELHEEQVEKIRDSLGADLSVGAVHALMDYARFLNEKSLGTVGQFETALYLEADGVTDGPVNALVNFVSGAFTASWLDLVNRGGLFLGSTMTALADYVGRGKDQSEDIYQKTTNIFRRKLQELGFEVAADLPSSQMNSALLSLLGGLLPDLVQNERGEISEILRGITKNPLTVTVYGSSVGGIADKITGQVLDELYKQLSENGGFKPNQERALRMLTTRKVVKNNGKYWVKNLVDETNTRTGTGENFELTPDMVENLKANIQELFAKPLNLAIEEIMGDALVTADFVRQATQVQAIHLKYAFREAVANALKAGEMVDGELVAKASLSQAEMKRILDDLLKQYPMIDTGTQLIFVGGSARADIESTDFGRGLDDGLKSDGYLWGPENPGVSGIPYLVIATGDGQMILNALTGEAVPEGMLPVFDGINLPLDKVRESSARINQAVLDGWKQNPVRALADSFAEFIKQTGADRLASMSQEMQLEVSQALFGLGSDGEPVSDLGEALVDLRDQLEVIATELDARKAVLGRINMSVDHMASAASPFVVSDQTELPADPVEAVTKLNEMFEEELTKLKAEPKPKPEAPSEEIQKELEQLGQVDETGTRLINRGDLQGVVDSWNIPSSQKLLIKTAVNSLTTLGWGIRVGTEVQLRQHMRNNGLTEPPAGRPIHGVAMPGDKMLYLVTASSETLAHELLHASTVERVYGFYTGKYKNDGEIAGSVRRLELLMEQFLSTKLTDLPGKLRADFWIVRNAIEQASNGSMSEALQKTAQLNEFMAWVLTNQDLKALTENTPVKSKLARIVDSALVLLKKIWRKGLAPSVGDDVYSNVRFNTLVIMESKEQMLGSAEALSGFAQFQSAQYGDSQRITDLELGFIERMVGILKKARARDPMTAVKIKAEHENMYRVAAKVRKSFQSAYSMSMQEASLFETLITAFAVDNDLDGNAQSRLQELFREVIGKLEVEDFLADPDNADENQRYMAKMKYDLVVGNYFTGRDADGRSTMLAAFLALANTNGEFRKILGKMAVKRGAIAKGKTLDETLTNAAEEAMNRLSQKMAGDGRNPDVLSAIDVLTRRLAESQADREAYIEQFVNPVGNGVDKANSWIVEQMTTLSQKAGDALNRVGNDSNNRLVKLGAQAGEALVGIFNEDVAGRAAVSVMSLVSKGDRAKPIQELLNEVIGRTSENAPIYDLIKASRAFIQQLRQIYRERLPGVIGSKFGRALSEKEWSALHDGLAKTDLAALAKLGTAKVLGMLQDAQKVTAETKSLEAEIAKLDGSNAALILKKSQELADYMTTGKVSGNLLRNADAIGSLFNELPVRIRKSRGQPAPELATAIDRLVTLYALGSLPAQTRQMISKLITDEKSGMEFVFDYLVGQRNDELAKSSSSRARLNHYKGYVPSANSSGESLIVADDRKYADLNARGYVRMGDYAGSLSEGQRRSMGYYHAPLSGRAQFNQGISQNIRQTQYGVDPSTGYTIDNHNAGRISDPQQVMAITRNLRVNGQQGEPLLPVFDADGEVVAYERSLDPRKLAHLQRETDLSKILGIWRGRQLEESAAQQLNVTLVGRLQDIWEKRGVGRDDEFVDLLNPKSHKDPVISDAVSLFTPEMHRTIRDAFPDGQFMVRRDMINDAIGYRTASVGDLWTGVTRLDPQTAKTAATVATAVFGRDAYKHLVTAEKLWQNFVSDARTTIVVRSVIVPVANMMSNVYQLASRGVPLASILRGLPKKLAEIRTYHETHQREVALEAEIRAAQRNPRLLVKLQSELKSIRDAHRRLSIWPLIQAGEFSSVSEATVMTEETTLFEGKLSGYVEGLVNKLPDSVRTAGRYAIISRDTALYRGLQLSVEYGDFLAKAVLYDDLVKRQGKPEKDALVQISSEFINFDRLPGRFRGSLENMGLLWFWHFKLRAIKVALSTARNNPLHLLLAGMVPAPDIVGSVGTPFTDNAIALGLESKLEYSTGPLMGVHAHAMNPWFNLVS